MSQRREHWRAGLRITAAIFFVGAGVNHFRKPEMYREIVPSGFGPPATMVAISGMGEIAGGLGLLIRPLRRLAGWGLIALLIAVFPANIYMLIHRGRIPGWNIPTPLLWLRLPLQGVMIWWIWFVALSRPRNQPF